MHVGLRLLGRFGHALALAAPALVLLALAGCSTRRVLTIDSDPPGARVWVNGTLQQGTTPVEVEFVHAGRFDLRFEKRGYESVATSYEVPTSVADLPVADLAFETFTRERRYRHVVTLRPLTPAPTEADVQAVMGRASAFREQTRREVQEARPPERLLPSTGIVP